MTTSNAEFSITGSVSGASPFADVGFDAVEGETLTFQLEASPGLDIRSTLFSVERVAQAGQSMALSGSGVPPTPLGVVTSTVPTGLAAYLMQCKVNGGVDAGAVIVPSWTKQRIVVVRSLDGLRQMVPTERQQYDALYGWVEAFNLLVDRVAGVSSAASGTLTRSEYWIQGSVAGGAGATTIWTYPMTDPSNVQVRFAIEAWDDVADDAASYVGYRTAKRKGAGAVAVGATTPVHVVEDDAAWDLTLAPSGNNLILQLTPDAANLTEFEGTLQVTQRLG